MNLSRSAQRVDCKAPDELQPVSRRQFIETAVVGSLSLSAPAIADAGPAGQRNRLEELLEQYGSELGAVRRVERG